MKDNIQSSLTKKYIFIIGSIIGFISYYMIFGLDPLNVSNHKWLYGGDPTTYFLGAAFFQKSSWFFPPGLNPNYGLDIQNSILLSDSIPLLAFPFKFLSKLTGDIYQYIGIWLLICFVLQGIIATKLGWLISKSHLIAISFALLLIFMPQFLSRSIQLAHFPLCFQFSIICSIYFYLNKKNNYIKWQLLILITSFTQPYILAMTLVIFIAFLLKKLLQKQEMKIIITQLIITIVSVSLSLYLIGFFNVSQSMSNIGYGIHKANLLSIFDSVPGHKEYSYLFSETPKINNSNNAPNFMGGGLVIIFTIALIVFIKNIKSINTYNFRENYPLIFLVILMFLFALSNNIEIGSYKIHFKLNSYVLNIFNVFRASERFVWPFLYLLPVFSYFILEKNIKNKKIIVYLFLLAGIFQFVDTSKSWSDVSKAISNKSGNYWDVKLYSQFWHAIDQNQYKYLRRYPLQNANKGYGDLAYLALSKDMETNSVYLSRFDKDFVKSVNEKFESNLKNNQLNAETIYIIEEKYLKDIIKIKTNDDLLETIDGYLVFAKNWNLCTACNKMYKN